MIGIRRLAAVVITSIAAVVAVPGIAAAADTPTQYVALGDSYAAGTGAGDYYVDGSICFRSQNAYAPVWSEETGAELEFAACGGATIPDVYDNQIEKLNDDTDLVTLSIGGNDVGFADIMISCTILPDFACIDKIDAAEEDGVNRVAGELAQLYADIAAAAPNAEVHIVGYPHLFNEENCVANLGMSIVEQQRVNSGVDTMNDVIEQAATEAGFGFINPTAAFDGHGVCANPEFMNGLELVAFESFHPNALGHYSGFLPELRAVA
ncbi:SGNH/GDSL hydrolase family protein [Haloglycomyces albus]|uniref:SGNH/GDSL hydrolase family protein n=1 Tax=Haloglycomyces albus TaxID=526067 RepID=UPI00046CD883|nr:SGNH/GDSL hydrolase family protein [Haloglycomyces albus]